MTRKTAADFDPEVLKLFDQYVHGGITRRDFLASAGRYAVGGATAASLLGALSPSFAAPLAAPDDKRIKARYVELPSPQGNGTVRGYLVSPADAKGKLPLVLVVHENRGLNAHIKDIARRVALEGFVALAPDFLSDLGGTPSDEDAARALFSDLSAGDVAENGIATVAYLKSLPDVTGKVGAIGFCWGGGTVNNLAVASPDLAAAVAYYGGQPDAAKVPNIKARVMLHYAGLDERINAGIPEYEAALKAAGTDYQLFIYDGVNHAFNNETSAARYDKAAADLAWSRTIALFKETLA